MKTSDLAAQIRAYNEWTPQELIKEYTVRASSKGEGKRYNAITEMAQQLAGLPSDDRKSKEYKAARRNVERWLQGTRKPGKATKEKLSELGKQFKKPAPDRIKLDGQIAVNGSGKEYTRKRTVNVHISEDDWDALSELAEDEEAESELWDALAYEYGVDSMDLLEGNITIS